MKCPMLPLEPTKRVRLYTAGIPGDDDLRRRAAVAVAKRLAWSGWGLGVETGGGFRDQDRVDLFKRIVEGRNGKGYSTCSDAVTYYLASMGLRDESIIDRDDDNADGIPDEKQVEPNDDVLGRNHWIVGRAVTMLIEGSKKAGAWVDCKAGGPESDAGDWFWIGDHGMEHVGIFASAWRPCEDLDLGAVKAWYADTVEAGQVDAGGQCTCQYVEVIRQFADGRFFMSRKPGEAGRRLYGWGSLTAYTLSAPAQVPVSFEGGIEV